MKFTRPWHTCVAVLTCCVTLRLQPIASPQATGQSGRPIGVILAIDTSAKRITLKTDAGPEMGIEFQDSTRFLRVVPGSQDLIGAAKITLADVSVGDRILVRGHSGVAANSFVADMIVVMSKADLAKKQETERADWGRRGIGGVVTTVDLASREATIRVGDMKSGMPVVLELPLDVKFRRYSPDSIRFSDALASRLEELNIGDQVKARGTRSEDGTRFLVEELVFGSFRVFAAAVVALDAERGALQVMDLATKVQVEARVLPASLLRRLSPAAVEILGARMAGGGASPRSRDPGSGRDLQSMIEALPPLRLAELKAGDAVVISGTIGDDPAKLTAITVLAGVEPLLRPSSRAARAPDIGSWNLDLNMGVGAP